MATYQKEIPLSEIIKDLYRNYLTFESLLAIDGRNHILEHAYFIDEGGGRLRKVSMNISFWDMQGKLASVAPQKKKAFFYNVIMDMKQKDVAEIMGVSTVTVGDYVKACAEEIAEKYFAELQGHYD